MYTDDLSVLAIGDVERLIHCLAVLMGTGTALVLSLRYSLLEALTVC